MLTFEQYVDDVTNINTLAEALVNKHSTHIEELIFTDGKKGVDNAIEGLQYIVNTIGQQTNNAISTKIDGCVHKDTKVLTTSGSKRICELTNNDFIGCFDVVRNRVVYVNNTKPRITKGSKDWVQLIFDNHGTVKCTFDHQWLTAHKQYVEAINLVHRNVYCVNNEQKRMFVHNVTKLQQKYEQWDLTTKYHNFIINVDGAYIVIHNSPAVFLCNTDKGFAVASKSIFNKNPKLNYTDKDIEANHTGGLVPKLKACLKYLKNVVPNVKNKIWQGDMLFTNDELTTFNKNGKKLVGFQPNTILYTADANSSIGKSIASSKLGIAMHTQYDWDGSDPSTMEVEKFGISADIFKDNKDVFLIDTIVKNQSSSKVAFTTQQISTIQACFKRVKNVENSIDWSVLDSDLGQHLQTYINSYIRDNVPFGNPKQLAEKFFDWIDKNVAKLKDQRKTTKGKQNVDQRYSKIVGTKKQIGDIEKLFEIFSELTKVKLMIIEKLNNLQQYSNFVVKSNGDLVATGDEGFVLTSTSAKGAKLVDRYTFSHNNFSSDLLKGWMHHRD